MKDDHVNNFVFIFLLCYITTRFVTACHSVMLLHNANQATFTASICQFDEHLYYEPTVGWFASSRRRRRPLLRLSQTSVDMLHSRFHPGWCLVDVRTNLLRRGCRDQICIVGMIFMVFLTSGSLRFFRKLQPQEPLSHYTHMLKNCTCQLTCPWTLLDCSIEPFHLS